LRNRASASAIRIIPSIVDCSALGVVEEAPDDGGDGSETRSLSERLTGLQARRRYGTALATMQGYLGEEAAKQRAKKARQMLAAAGHDKVRCGCPQCTEERNLAWEKQTDEDGKTYHYNTVTGMSQVILPTAPGVSKEGEVRNSWPSRRLFLGPGFRLGPRWNRLVETVKTRKERRKTGQEWARYSLRSVAGRELTKDQLPVARTGRPKAGGGGRAALDAAGGSRRGGREDCGADGGEAGRAEPGAELEWGV